MELPDLQFDDGTPDLDFSELPDLEFSGPVTPPEGKDFFERTGADLSRRATKFGEFAERQVSDAPLLRKPEGAITIGAAGIGQVAGGIGDIVGQAVISLVDVATPEGIQTAAKDKLNEFAATDVGRIGLYALTKGAKAYKAFEGDNPDAAVLLESALNLVGLGAGKKIAGKVAKIVRADKAVGALHDTVFDKLPSKLIESTLKMPTSKAWIKTLPGKEITKRTATVTESLKSKIPHSELGLSKAKALTKEAHAFVDDVTKTLSTDPTNKIKLNKAIARGLKSAYQKAKVSSNPKEAFKMIKKIKNGLKQHGDIMTPHKANALKRELYDEINWFQEGLDPLTIKSKKGVAHQIMKQIEGIYPSIRPANATLSARMGVVEALEKSLVRSGNKNMVSLGTKVMAAGAHPMLAVPESVLAIPRVKAAIANFLAKANPKKYSQFLYPEKPKGYAPRAKKMETALKIEKDEAERLARLEAMFAAQADTTKGPPLRMPDDGYVKSKIPMSVEERLRGL